MASILIDKLVTFFDKYAVHKVIFAVDLDKLSTHCVKFTEVLDRLSANFVKFSVDFDKLPIHLVKFFISAACCWLDAIPLSDTGRGASSGVLTVSAIPERQNDRETETRKVEGLEA